MHIIRMSKVDRTVNRKNLVGTTSQALRDRVFALEPGEQIGSLRDLARQFGVGIVTLQQAARVLEHEGLLVVRRGPGGGYYGTRPNNDAVARAISAYLRAHPTSFEEALNLTSLLFIELVAAAASCDDAELRDKLRALEATIDECGDEERWGAFENRFQDLLFEMVRWPLFQLLTQVTLSVAHTRSHHTIGGEDGGLARWKAGRRRIISAILAGDVALARFEADRNNRRLVLESLQAEK